MSLVCIDIGVARVGEEGLRPYAIRAKLICAVRACTRGIYSSAGFGERLLAWLTSEPPKPTFQLLLPYIAPTPSTFQRSLDCTSSFCPKWSRLP